MFICYFLGTACQRWAGGLVGTLHCSSSTHSSVGWVRQAQVWPREELVVLGPLPPSLGTLGCEDLANVPAECVCLPRWGSCFEAVGKKGGVSGLLSSSPGWGGDPRALCCVCGSVDPFLSVAIFVMSSSPIPVSAFCKWLLGEGACSILLSLSLHYFLEEKGGRWQRYGGWGSFVRLD